MERSSDQIVNPVNIKALTEWVGTFPIRLLSTMDQTAPMLKVLGYDPNANPPNYGQADQEILNNTNILNQNVEYWEAKKVQLMKEMEKPMDNSNFWANSS